MLQVLAPDRRSHIVHVELVAGFDNVDLAAEIAGLECRSIDAIPSQQATTRVIRWILAYEASAIDARHLLDRLKRECDEIRMRADGLSSISRAQCMSGVLDHFDAVSLTNLANALDV